MQGRRRDLSAIYVAIPDKLYILSEEKKRRRLAEGKEGAQKLFPQLFSSHREIKMTRRRLVLTKVSDEPTHAAAKASPSV